MAREANETAILTLSFPKFLRRELAQKPRDEWEAERVLEARGIESAPQQPERDIGWLIAPAKKT